MSLGYWYHKSFISCELNGFGAKEATHQVVLTKHSSFSGQAFNAYCYRISSTGSPTLQNIQSYTIPHGIYELFDAPIVIKHLRDNLWMGFVYMWENVGTNTRCYVGFTFSTDDDGLVAGILDYHEFHNVAATTSYYDSIDVLKFGNNMYGTGFRAGNGSVQHFSTFTVDADGTITEKDDHTFTGSNASGYGRCCIVNNNVALLVGYNICWTFSVDTTTGIVTDIATGSGTTVQNNAAAVIRLGETTDSNGYWFIACSSGSIQPFTVSKDGVTISVRTDSDALGNGSNRTTPNLFYCGEASGNDYYHWSSRDSGDGDLDIGQAYITSVGNNAWGYTDDSVVSLSVSSGGIGLGKAEIVFWNPNEDGCSLIIGHHEWGLTIDSVEADVPDPNPPTNMVITGLIHRYDRKNRIYNLEIVYGGVTNDFGMPDWSTEPVETIKNETTEAEEVKKETKKLSDTMTEQQQSDAIRGYVPQIEYGAEEVNAAAKIGLDAYKIQADVFADWGYSHLEVRNMLFKEGLSPQEIMERGEKRREVALKTESVFNRFNSSNREVREMLKKGMSVPEILQELRGD